MSIYSYSAETLHGEKFHFSSLKGKVVLIVNTASDCGFAPQFHQLQQLYEKYEKQGFIILAFPSDQFQNQERATAEEIEKVCQLKYGVTFPVFQKIKVKGPHKEAIFTYLTKQAPGFLTNEIKWNFTKFLINRKGEVVRRFAPFTKPLKIVEDIKNLIAD